MQFITHSLEETDAVGAELAGKLAGGSIMTFTGDLGAGKTAIIKSIARHLGIPNELTSPTFTLMNVYPVLNHPSIKTLVHIDTYRLKDEQELIEIGVEDYLGRPGITTLIEWPEKVANLLTQKKVTNVFIDHLDETSRSIQIK